MRARLLYLPNFLARTQNALYLVTQEGVAHDTVGRTGVTRCRLSFQEESSNAMSPSGLVRKLVPPSPDCCVMAVPQNILLPFCNCGKDALLAQILHSAWFRISGTMHQLPKAIPDAISKYNSEHPHVLQTSEVIPHCNVRQDAAHLCELISVFCWSDDSTVSFILC